MLLAVEEASSMENTWGQVQSFSFIEKMDIVIFLVEKLGLVQ